ncbi:MAG: hypothetical protein ABL888_21870 [Pirellulaceae bacterium]
MNKIIDDFICAEIIRKSILRIEDPILRAFAHCRYQHGDDERRLRIEFSEFTLDEIMGIMAEARAALDLEIRKLIDETSQPSGMASQSNPSFLTWLMSFFV